MNFNEFNKYSRISVKNNNLNRLKTSTNFINKDIYKYIGILQWLYGIDSSSVNSTEKTTKPRNITTDINVARNEGKKKNNE